MNEQENSTTALLRQLRVPYLLFADDLSRLLRISQERVQQALRLGLIGPAFSIDGEPCILRADMEGNLRLCSGQVHFEDRELIRDLDQAEGTAR